MLPFGETVLAWRLVRGMTQAQLARAARIPRPNLSHIEGGDRDVTLGTLRSLAVALDVTPGTLADGIAPFEGPSPSGRAAMERIAAAAFAGGALADPREAELAGHLRTVTRVGADGAPDRPRRSGRAVARAYLLLKASAAPETVASLIARVSDRRRRHPG